MSDTENRESTSAPQGEAIAATPIPTDAVAAAPAAPAPKPNRIADSSFEAAHADLPPLSTIGGESAPATTSADPAAANGARRGRGRGAPAGKFGAAGTPSKVPMGAVENPSDMTESLSGKHVAGYADAKPETKPEAKPAAEPAAPKATESGIKEFVPPVSEGTFKAELNPESERKAREERRQQRDQRPQGENRQPRENREPREPRRDEARQPRENHRDDRRQQGEQPRRPQGENRHERQRPGRLTIEAPKIPVVRELSVFGKIKRAIASLFGVPARDEVEYDSVSRQFTPHSREWQFGRNRDAFRGNRDGFRQGNHRGGDNRGNPNRDSRHRPHARGGNHRDHHGRDGNPRG